MRKEIFIGRGVQKRNFKNYFSMMISEKKMVFYVLNFGSVINLKKIIQRIFCSGGIRVISNNRNYIT